MTENRLLCCEGHFLGLTVCNAGDIAATVTYECDADDDVTDDVSDAAEQFDDMMKNLGAAGLLEKFVYIARNYHRSGATRGHMSPIAIPPVSYCHCDVILIMTSFATRAAGTGFLRPAYRSL